MAKRPRKAIVFLVCRRDGRSSEKLVIDRMSKSKPATSGDEVAIRVVVEMADEMFDEAMPEVEIVVEHTPRFKKRVKATARKA